MSQNLRLKILVLSCYINFFIYMLMIYVTFMNIYKWSFIEFWFFSGNSIQPFFVFLAITVIELVWALSELYVLVSLVAKKLFGAVTILVILVFLGCTLLVHNAHWQYKQYANGEIKCEDFLIKKYDCAKNANSKKIKIPEIIKLTQ